MASVGVLAILKLLRFWLCSVLASDKGNVVPNGLADEKKGLHSPITVH
jgi:hypothetical protein